MKMMKPVKNNDIAFLKDVKSIDDVRILKERRKLYLELTQLELKSATIRLESSVSAENVSDIIVHQMVRSVEKLGLMTFRKFLKKWI
jgi:hypothetical protein